jgi:hypothetical protein
VYAPADAADLEFQLDEWYSYLPRLVYFERDEVMRLAHNRTDGALEGFLQTQYYSCKTSILLAGGLSGNGIWGSGRRLFGLLLGVLSFICPIHGERQVRHSQLQGQCMDSLCKVSYPS